MIEPAECYLEFAPTGEMVQAQIVSLTPELVEHRVTRTWWTDMALKDFGAVSPIDRDWNWEEVEIERAGRVLESELVGVMTQDGYVQGAMLISREPVESALDPGEKSLFVELLFTAPRNRSILRKDGIKFFGGVGLELLRWGMRFSRKLGAKGRLRLDGSPDYVGWYAKLGFQKLSVEPVVFEGVEYLPMEIPLSHMAKLLGS